MTPEEVAAFVCAHPRVRARGGGSKPALSNAPSGVTSLDLSGLSGVLAYDPAEYTFTALAGTPVRDVNALLARHGQHLPFDPPLVDAGATLGGTVAAGLSGPGRWRYGGVRDFVLGVQFVDGTGTLRRGGGRVVKNAAGFDLPKLMVGSVGQLGVLTELSFKVFPAPPAHRTLAFKYGTLGEALSALLRLAAAPFDLICLDLRPEGTLLLRIGGVEAALDARAARLAAFLGRPAEVLPDEPTWGEAREFRWADGPLLVRVPLTPEQVLTLDAGLSGFSRRYSAGGNLAWVSGNEADLPRLNAHLKALGLGGLVLRGHEDAHVGVPPGGLMLQRVRQVMDPPRRFA